MIKILGMMALGLLLSGNAYTKNNITKTDFQNRIIKNGKTGFILRYHKEKSPSKFEIILPKNSPPIISDYHSKYGVLGGSRSKPKKHGGIDFYIKVGSSILAAGNGKVYGVKIKDKCIGNKFAIYFGKSPDGIKLHASHMHVGKILVMEGDIVKRGQRGAKAWTQVKKNCGGGMEHLHFHMSKKKVKAHQEVTGGLWGI